MINSARDDRSDRLRSDFGLGVRVRVAALPDLVQAKIWSWSDPQQRFSKRKKDELDLIRIAERYPRIVSALPAPIRGQLGA